MSNGVKRAVFVALAVVVVAVLAFSMYGGPGTVSNAQQNTQSKVDPAIIQRIQNLENIIKTDPNNVRALNELGQLYLEIDDGRKAQVAFKAGLELEPNNVDLHNGLGTAYCSVNKISEAIAEYKKSMEIDPSSPDAYYFMGQTFSHMQSPDIPKAIEYWGKAIELAPGSQLAKLSQENIDKNRNAPPQSPSAPALTQP